MRTFRDQSILKTRTGADFMMLFNSWYYSFSPTLAGNIQAHPTQRAIFRDALYPLFAILYVSYYSYLLLSPVSSEVAAAMAGVVAAGLIGLVYMAPASYLCARLLRRRFRSSRSVSSRLNLWLTVSVALTGLAYFTGEMLLLGIAATNLVLTSMALGCVAGTYALTRLEAFSPWRLMHVRRLLFGDKSRFGWHCKRFKLNPFIKQYFDRLQCKQILSQC